MDLRSIDFTDTQSDLAVLGQVCDELESRGMSPNEAAAHVLAGMANQAVLNGLDPTEAVDALHKVISNTYGNKNAELVCLKKRVVPLTEKQLEDVQNKVKFLQNFLLYYDMILCTEIQRQAYLVTDELKSKGMYRHKLKKYANALNEEARRLQMRVKDNDRMLVLKWCARTDKRNVFVKRYHEAGGSVASRMVLSFLFEFKKEWSVIELDCRTVAKRFSSNISNVVSTLLKLEMLTNTGIELYDTCVKQMKMAVAGHGTASIKKSTHHESMRHACHNLLRELGVGLTEASETETRYARQHCAELQMKMTKAGMDNFFQREFDKMTEEFVDCMMAWMRLELRDGKVKTGSIRMVLERLGTKHRTRKFFRQLSDVKLSDEDTEDVFDVVDDISAHEGSRGGLDRFRKFCIEDRKFELPESEDTQELRMLRILSRRNGGMLPDDILRVMVMKRQTKKSVVELLSRGGFELDATLQKIRKMKASQLKEL